jgi:hypothetical protein
MDSSVDSLSPPEACVLRVGPLPITCPALPVAVVLADLGVLWRELMTPNAVGLAGVDGCHAHASQGVLSPGDGLQMIRVHTCSVAAQVI